MVSSGEFRRVLGQFATGVAIVTAQGPDRARAGVTINSFASVSLEPGLVLFSLARNLRSIHTFIDSDCFGISILAAEQREVSDRFAGGGADKWSGIPLDDEFRRVPFIERALAKLECERQTVVEGGDHLIFICRVVHIESDADRHPLLFFRGRYWRPEGAPLSL